jgi:hypothetical protein
VCLYRFLLPWAFPFFFVCVSIIQDFAIFRSSYWVMLNTGCCGCVLLFSGFIRLLPSTLSISFIVVVFGGMLPKYCFCSMREIGSVEDVVEWIIIEVDGISNAVPGRMAPIVCELLIFLVSILNVMFMLFVFGGWVMCACAADVLQRVSRLWSTSYYLMRFVSRYFLVCQVCCEPPTSKKNLGVIIGVYLPD